MNNKIKELKYRDIKAKAQKLTNDKERYAYLDGVSDGLKMGYAINKEVEKKYAKK